MAVEIELKFQVPPARLAALRRAVATRTAQSVDLQAWYQDTADGHLARARLAWRVRREGDRWVQTLKGPGDGLAHRLEHEVPCAPVADGTVPAADAGLHAGTEAGRLLARALAGGGPVQAVYGTQILRLKRVLRHGGARIELALDLGDVVAGQRRAPVCELEMELLDGPLPALLSLARTWAARFGLLLDPATKSERARWLIDGLATRPVVRGAEPALIRGLPLNEARAAMVTAALAHGLPNAAAVTAGAANADHVHQLRVALRRLRSVLRALGPADTARDGALKTLFAALGRRRDADVMQGTLAPAWAAAEAAGWPRPPQEPMDDPAAAVLAAPVTTARWLDLLALTVPDDASESPAWESEMLNHLRRGRRRARRLAADWDRLDIAQRHHLRKQLKRWRYLLEFAAPLLPARRLRAELARLRPLQEALGHWNDLVVARAHLAAWPQPTPAVVFAAGWLARAALEAERDGRRAVRRWRAADDGLRASDLRA